MRFKPKGKPKKGKSKPKSSIISRGITSLFGNKKKSSSNDNNKRKNASDGSYGLDNYNGMIMEIYDANTTTPEGVNETIPVEKKESKDGESKLVSETLRLRNTAVLNLKLKEKIFKYEKNRLNKLRLGGEGGAGGGAGASSGVTPIIPGEGGDGPGLPGIFRNPLRRAPKRTPKTNPNQPKNRNKNRNKNKSRNKNKNRNRNKPRSSNKPVTRGKGGARPNPFRRFNPFKPKVTSGKPAVPPGLNNPFKGLGNPFKRFGPKPSITIGGANKIPKGLNNPFDVFRKGPNVTRSMPQIPRGLQSPLGGLGLPKIRNPFAGPKVTTGGATRPFGLGPGASPTVTTGGVPAPKGFRLPKISPKGIVSGVKGFGIGLGLEMAGEFVIEKSFNAIFGTPEERLKRLKEKQSKKSSEEQKETIEKITEKLRKELEYQQSPLHVADKVINFGGQTTSEGKSKIFTDQLQALGAPIPEMKEGGITEDKPQLVIVGDGGEKEYIVPESKLSYFLGTSQAAKYLNYGVSPLVTAATDYAKAAGIKTYGIPEMQDLTNIQRDIAAPIKGIALIQTTFSDLGDTIFDFVTEGFMSIMEPVKKIIEFVKNIIPPGIKKAVKGFAGFMGNLFGGRPAAAATLPPSLRTNLNGNLNMSSEGVFNTGLKTGKSAYIGGSDDYHIDTKFSSSLSMEEKVRMMDQLAAGYAAQGRKIEFSNSMIANTIYDPNASMEEKSALLQKAFEAHNLPRGRAIDQGGFNSIDYYAPLMGENRFGSSVEGQDILVPTVDGGKVNYHQGGGYGAFITMTDAQGNVILKTGHGDVRTAKTGSVSVPSKPALNKDTAVDQDPLDEIQADLPLMNLFKLPTPPPPDPLVIPLSTRLGQKLSSSNTPAWGNAALIGG